MAVRQPGHGGDGLLCLQRPEPLLPPFWYLRLESLVSILDIAATASEHNLTSQQHCRTPKLGTKCLDTCIQPLRWTSLVLYHTQAVHRLRHALHSTVTFMC